MEKVTDNFFLLIVFAMTGTFVLAASFIFFFLRYQRKIALQKSAMQKAEIDYGIQLLNATLVSQEDERKRIGRDLHDDVGASLSNLKMIMAQTVETEEGKAKYKPLIDNIITTVRNISHTLSPSGLELFGLEHALIELVDSFNISGNIHVELNNGIGTKIDGFEKQTALALYRVIQELLSNTIKHSGAKKVMIDFENEEGNFILYYKDDGRGLQADAERQYGMGMKNIEARLQSIQAKYTLIKESGFAIKIWLKA